MIGFDLLQPSTKVELSKLPDARLTTSFRRGSLTGPGARPLGRHASHAQRLCLSCICWIAFQLCSPHARVLWQERGKWVCVSGSRYDFYVCRFPLCARDSNELVDSPIASNELSGQTLL